MTRTRAKTKQLTIVEKMAHSAVNVPVIKHDPGYQPSGLNLDLQGVNLRVNYETLVDVADRLIRVFACK